MDIAGTRETLKDHIQAQSDVFVFDAADYEGCITSLFIPWLIDEIPDSKWQTLQQKLKIIILKIISNGRVKK